jgi:hypothetical protein
MAVRVAVHHPSPDSTWDIWLDSTLDLSSANSTREYWVNVEHQPTDMVLVPDVTPNAPDGSRRVG